MSNVQNIYNSLQSLQFSDSFLWLDKRRGKHIYEDTIEQESINMEEKFEVYSSPQEIADKHKSLSIEKLAQMRYTGSGPIYYNPTPRVILYKLSEVERWIESSARISTQPEAPVGFEPLQEWRKSHQLPSGTDGATK